VQKRVTPKSLLDYLVKEKAFKRQTAVPSHSLFVPYLLTVPIANRTPLHYAAEFGSNDIAKLILNRGGATIVNQQDHKGETVCNDFRMLEKNNFFSPL
jgi:Ankyrin repeat